jgi:hypothetical protein
VAEALLCCLQLERRRQIAAKNASSALNFLFLLIAKRAND